MISDTAPLQTINKFLFPCWPPELESWDRFGLFHLCFTLSQTQLIPIGTEDLAMHHCLEPTAIFLLKLQRLEMDLGGIHVQTNGHWGSVLGVPVCKEICKKQGLLMKTHIIFVGWVLHLHTDHLNSVQYHTDICHGLPCGNLRRFCLMQVLESFI